MDRKQKSPLGEEGSQLAGAAPSLGCAAVTTEPAQQICPARGDWLGRHKYPGLDSRPEEEW